MSSERDALNHLARIERVLHRAHKKNGREMFVPPSSSPLDELLAKEDEVRAEMGVEVFSEFSSALMEFFFADGPHPGAVMRRLYAWVKKYRSELILDMSVRDLGEMFGETGAAVSWRIGKIFDGYQRKAGQRGVHAPWQKSEETRRKLSQAQMGNRNRLGGKRGVSGAGKQRRAA